jgi:hypothetical protein
MVMVTSDTTDNLLLIPLMSATDCGESRGLGRQGMLREFAL